MNPFAAFLLRWRYSLAWAAYITYVWWVFEAAK